MAATWNGDVPIIERLLTAGAKVHVVNRRLNTAMHFAAEKQHIEIVYVDVGPVSQKHGVLLVLCALLTAAIACVQVPVPEERRLRIVKI